MFNFLLGFPRASKAGYRPQGASKISVEQLTREVVHLEDRMDKLAVLSTALWMLLQERVNLTEAELQEYVARVEAMRLTTPQEQNLCPECGRAMQARSRHCMYCDYQEPDSDAFSSVTR